MSKFVLVQEDDLRQMKRLFENARDNEYVLLQESNGFSDIAQYSDKYQALRIVTVVSKHLDWTNRLA